jgi:hypothetical protein
LIICGKRNRKSGGAGNGTKNLKKEERIIRQNEEPRLANQQTPPPGAVLEALGEKHAEDGSLSVGFMLIPLESGIFSLKVFSIRHEGYILERPALRIPVRPAGD